MIYEVEKNEKLQALEIAKEYINSGEDIPFEFKKILFSREKKECDLTYLEKQSAEKILSNITAVPLQIDRVFPKEASAIDNDWTNKLIFGENSQILKSLIQMKKEGKLKNSDGSDGVRLIYIDPPFATKQDFKISGSDQVAYADKISSAEFIEFLRKRLILAKELLAEDGSIFVHLDCKMSHYIKIILDEVFGKNCFINEIVWGFQWGGHAKDRFAEKHNTIFWYGKNNDKNHIFNDRYAREKYLTKDTRWHNNPDGKLMRDVWNDIPTLNTQSKERTSYPTQKPEMLLERIINTTTNTGDIVLDFFAGSGTTPVVAENLKRRWIAIDIGKYSIYTIQKRLLKLKNINPFILFSAGLYDSLKTNQFDSENWKMFALNLWGCQIEKTEIKGLTFDGFKNNCLVKVYSPQELNKTGAKISYETIDNINTIIHKNAGSEIFIIAPQGQFDFAEDEIEIKDRIFYILRVPYSLLAKFTENFTPITQPKTINNINEIVDSVGFDFIQPPIVEFSINQDELSIKNFKSNSRIKGEQVSELSMILIDYDYNGEYFDLDEQYFNNDIYEIDNKTQKKTFKKSIKIQKIKNSTMFIFIDNSGNEKRVIFNGK